MFIYFYTKEIDQTLKYLSSKIKIALNNIF